VNANIAGAGSVGILVGVNEGSISNAHSTGVVAGVEIYGGLVGDNEGVISNSYSTAAVAGARHAGGLVGSNGGTIANSYSTGSVTLTAGIYLGSDTPATFGGGFVGVNNGLIINSHSSGNVMVDTSYDPGYGSSHGGFVGGNDGTITNSYSTGTVTVDYGDGGGFVGNNSGTINNSYWDTQTSRLNTSAGGVGLTTVQMKTLASFIGWDFTNTWSIAEGQSYPQLRNVGGPGNTGGSTGGTNGTGAGSNNSGTNNENNIWTQDPLAALDKKDQPSLVLGASTWPPASSMIEAKKDISSALFLSQLSFLFPELGKEYLQEIKEYLTGMRTTLSENLTAKYNSVVVEEITRLKNEYDRLDESLKKMTASNPEYKEIFDQQAKLAEEISLLIAVNDCIKSISAGMNPFAPTVVQQETPTPKTEAICQGGICFPVKGKGTDNFINEGTYDSNGKPHSGRYSSNNCVDIIAKTGTPVYSIMEGKVITIKEVKDKNGNYTSFGIYIEIQHPPYPPSNPSGPISLYAHLNPGSVSGLKVGDKVDAGQQIAQVGSTGNTGGTPHLHFEISNKTPSTVFKDEAFQ